MCLTDTLEKQHGRLGEQPYELFQSLPQVASRQREKEREKKKQTGPRKKRAIKPSPVQMEGGGVLIYQGSNCLIFTWSLMGQVISLVLGESKGDSRKEELYSSSADSKPKVCLQAWLAGREAWRLLKLHPIPVQGRVLPIPHLRKKRTLSKVYTTSHRNSDPCNTI